MHELLTQPKTPEIPRQVAGIKSEWWPASNRNGGRHQIGIPGRLPSESPLPAYSPELNCMENVWEYLRQNKLCATVWENYAQILDACKAAWNWLIADLDRITSIGSRDWACVSL